MEPCIPKRSSQAFKSCCELIVERGIEAVVIAMTDDSSAVGLRRGIHYLKKKGVKVVRYKGLNKIIKRDLMPKDYFRLLIR